MHKIIHNQSKPKYLLSFTEKRSKYIVFKINIENDNNTYSKYLKVKHTHLKK